MNLINQKPTFSDSRKSDSDKWEVTLSQTVSI